MSGIFGIFNISGEPVEEEYLQKMQKKTAQYGRDGQDIRVDGSIGLGCCLSKFGISSQEDMPIYDDEKLTLVCDALIWNRAELLEKLGLNCESAISTQTMIVDTYKKWGKDCPKYINGDFAFAVWDKQNKQLFIARDHLGVRPLYYSFDGTTLVFSSDYRAFIDLPFVGKQLNEIKLYSLLSNTYHVNPEATYFEHIKKLPQAHTLLINARGLKKHKYWTPGANGKIRFKTEEKYAKALFDVVNDAIKLRLKGVKGGIGAELSGGLDSPVVTVLANRELKKTGRKLFPVSWAPPFELFEKQPGDERDLIEAVCRQESLECNYLDRRKALAQEKTQIALPTDGGGDELYRRELLIMSDNDVKFVLTGWGGDEGISHRADLHELFVRGYGVHFLREICKASKGSPVRFAKQIVNNTVMPLFSPYARFGNPNKGRPRIVNKTFTEKMKKSYKTSTFNFKRNPIKHIQAGGIQTRTELLAWVDADYSMQHLFPYLDYRVIDFAVSIPVHWYYKNGLSRYIYRKAFEKELPENFCMCSTKNDIATISYLNEAGEDWEKAEYNIKLLDEKSYSDLIDFDKLWELINSSVFEKNPQISRIILKRMESCFKIQQFVEEAETSISEGKKETPC